MDELSLAQYVMINWTYGNSFSNMRKGNRSVIYLKFTFQRTLGFYFLQIYVPLTIIVMSSWVSFWLVKTNQVKKIENAFTFNMITSTISARCCES